MTRRQRVFKNQDGYETSKKYKKSNEYLCPILNASKRKYKYKQVINIDHVTNSK